MDVRPAARIDGDRFALVVIDPQERLASVMPRREGVLAATGRLVALAGLLGAPIVATRQYPKGLGDLEPSVVEALEQAQACGSTVTVIDKLSFCACGEPEFVEVLQETGREQLVVVGMETHICVTQTALDLVGRGYAVQVVADACCSRKDEAHAVALDRLRAAGAVVTVAESVMYEAVPVAGTDEFRSLLGIVKGS